jgi:hypothetical protein
MYPLGDEIRIRASAPRLNGRLLVSTFQRDNLFIMLSIIQKFIRIKSEYPANLNIDTTFAFLQNFISTAKDARPEPNQPIQQLTFGKSSIRETLESTDHKKFTLPIPKMTSSPINVAIIGAGLSGLSLALALHQQNIPSTLYERNDAPLNIGGAVMLSPNALKVLDALSVYSRIRTKGYNFETLEYKDGDGKLLEVYEFGG